MMKTWKNWFRKKSFYSLEREIEIEANNKAWSLLSKNHYLHFRKLLNQKDYNLNPIILKEIGDVSGKKILHLQCNTGADSILLARMGAIVTGASAL